MKYILSRFFIITFLLSLSACSTTPPVLKTISISGVIEFPLPLEGDKYWLDDGPLFVSSRSPLLTYRVIDKEELKFSGSEKTVYEFFKSSFSKPEGIVEESFLSSHKEYELQKKYKGGIDFYILSKLDESKVYVVSDSIDIGIEIQATGSNARSVIESIINKAYLLKGD